MADTLQYGDFLTEQINPDTLHIDQMNTLDMVTLINREDHRVADAVQAVLPAVAEAVDAIAARLQNGGRLIYVGAGTSGRLGVLDAAECPPTYGVDPELVQGIMAGGPEAVFRAAENVEDDGEAAVRALQNIHFSDRDVCFGLSASGSAAFVRSALSYAREIGGLDVVLCCNPEAPINREVRIAIVPVVGAEVISGSTRMKAATAQKMVLTMVSTGVMIRLGRVQGNRMTFMRPTNKKLIERGIRMVTEMTGVSAEEAAEALKKADGCVEFAVRDIRAAHPGP